MNKHWLIQTAGALALSIVAPLRAQGTGLDEHRLLNSWYEIGRLPDKQQKQCSANGSNLIARGEGKGQLRWLWMCTDTKGNINTHSALAKPIGHTGSGTYKVQIIWLIWSKKYQVVGIAEDNSWMILGTPNHKELWLYSTTPNMDDAQFAQLKARADAAGYKTDKLIRQPQPNPAKVAASAPVP